MNTFSISAFFILNNNSSYSIAAFTSSTHFPNEIVLIYTKRVLIVCYSYTTRVGNQRYMFLCDKLEASCFLYMWGLLINRILGPRSCLSQSIMPVFLLHFNISPSPVPPIMLTNKKEKKKKKKFTVPYWSTKSYDGH
jgi:hypothetical protein